MSSFSVSSVEIVSFKVVRDKVITKGTDVWETVTNVARELNLP